MRIRSIKPDWLEDELMAAATDEARILSVALILMADDHGRGRASLATIAAETWRHQFTSDDAEKVRETLAKASRALRELVEMRFVVVYEVERQKYFAIRNWSKHQRVDKPGKPRIPAPPDACSPQQPRDVGQIREDSTKVQRVLAEDYADTSQTISVTLAPEKEKEKEKEKERESCAPAHVEEIGINAIVEAINRPRRRRNLSPINAMALHGQAAAPFFQLAEIFPEDTLARIESEHEAWLATATPKEIAEDHPWRYWLREPMAGSARAAKLLPSARVAPKRPHVSRVSE
jgi:hypothetical protein